MKVIEDRIAFLDRMIKSCEEELAEYRQEKSDLEDVLRKLTPLNFGPGVAAAEQAKAVNKSITASEAKK